MTLDASVRDTFGQTLGETTPLVFNVGSAAPFVTSNGGPFVVLDPAGRQRYSVFSVNHSRLKVSLYAVGPEHWGQFMDYVRYAQGYTDDAAMKQRTPPGKPVFARTVEVASRPDELTETAIDLRPALAEGGFGHAVVVVEPPVVTKRRRGESIVSWAQVTNIGLDAFVDQTDLLAWATSLRDGRPLAGVELSIYPGENGAQSGAEGLARLPLPAAAKQSTALLLARQGQDVAILPENFNWWNRGSNWHRREAQDALRWYVFDDRKMYRPGEEVHVKG
ncbi:MAG: hypothetical protein ACRD68_18905, partial [Pyrinomonadaceae bacterium]